MEREIVLELKDRIGVPLTKKQIAEIFGRDAGKLRGDSLNSFKSMLSNYGKYEIIGKGAGTRWIFGEVYDKPLDYIEQKSILDRLENRMPSDSDMKYFDSMVFLTSNIYYNEELNKKSYNDTHLYLNSNKLLYACGFFNDKILHIKELDGKENNIYKNMVKDNIDLCSISDYEYTCYYNDLYKHFAPKIKTALNALKRRRIIFNHQEVLMGGKRVRCKHKEGYYIESSEIKDEKTVQRFANLEKATMKELECDSMFIINSNKNKRIVFRAMLEAKIKNDKVLKELGFDFYYLTTKIFKLSKDVLEEYEPELMQRAQDRITNYKNMLCLEATELLKTKEIERMKRDKNNRYSEITINAIEDGFNDDVYEAFSELHIK